MRIGARRAGVTHVARSRALAGALLAAMAFVAGAPACGGAGFFRQYEYEEEMYLSLDGSATMYVNASIAALNALRGTSFDAAPSARFDRDAYRRYFSSADTHVTRVSTSRRSGRRFVHVRLDVDDVRRLSGSAPFAWSTYRFERDGAVYAFKQIVDGSGARLTPAPRPLDAVAGPGDPKWTGRELVAFRLHLPSKIEFHNSGREIGRGNILVWEQALRDRMNGVPLELDARMQTQSILYRTLWLFAVTFVLAALTFVALIVWVVRRGRPHQAGPAETAR